MQQTSKQMVNHIRIMIEQQMEAKSAKGSGSEASGKGIEDGSVSGTVNDTGSSFRNARVSNTYDCGP